MQYHIQTLVKHLFDKDSFEQVTVQELKQFTDDYPYAAVGQYLYAKKLKDSGSYNHYDQCEQASLYFHNALWLRWQLDHKEEVPALPVKAEEAAQQPGFRIVVQMPKTAPAIISTQPAQQPEETTEQEPAIEAPETREAVTASSTEQPVQAEAEQTATPVAEEAEAAEKENGLKVNKDGSLVEQEAVTEEQTTDTTPVPEENIATETASAVAIAEGSQLAEESSNIEAAVNAVSITEEVLIPPVVPAEASPEAEAEAIDKEIDDIIPAVEITPEEAVIPPVEEAAPVEVSETAAVAETTVTEEPAPTEVIAEVGEAAPVEEPTVVEETAVAEETASPEIVAEQPVEPVTEMVSSEEPALITAEATQPAANDLENTTDTPPAAVVAEGPVEVKPEVEELKPLIFTLASKEEKASVDLGEPIFESYHTIDYFASQGIKLMQEELKDKLGKQLKSFTDWLRSMKRIGPIDSSTSIDEVTNQSIQRIAEHSVEEKEVLTEAMAEVWAKQGNAKKAIRVYEKLSLLNPDKSPYFAGRIEQLKAQ
jgi:hypothetical protein